MTGFSITGEERLGILHSLPSYSPGRHYANIAKEYGLDEAMVKEVLDGFYSVGAAVRIGERYYRLSMTAIRSKGASELLMNAAKVRSLMETEVKEAFNAS